MANHNDIANALEKLGATVDRANFASNMRNPEYAERVRTALEGAGASVPDSTTFYNRYGVTPQETAKTQYEQDVATQRAENVQTANREHPVLAAIAPRALENLVTGDRGVVGSTVDIAKDISSLPGRFANAGIGYLVEGLAQNIQGATGEARTAESDFMKRMGQYTAPAEAGRAESIAQNIVTDPYAIPMIAIGGPIASKIAGSGLSALGKVGVGIGADAALNTGIGAFERGTSANPEEHALDLKKAAIDATIGGAFSGLMHGIGGTSSWLQNRGKTALGNEVIGSTPIKKREDLISNWSETGRAESYADRESAARAIGEELVTKDPSITILGGRDEVPTVTGSEELPLGVFNSKQKIMQNQLAKQREATGELTNQYMDLDEDYARAIEQLKNTTEDTRISPTGELVTGRFTPQGELLNVDLKSTGVPIEDIINEAYRRLNVKTNKAIDAKALQDAGYELSQRLDRIKSEQGTISPSAARDLKQRLFSEIRDNPKSMDLDEYYTQIYKQINDHLSGIQLNKARTSAESYNPEDFGGLGELARLTGLETPFASANKEVRSALQLGEGIDRSKYFNPSGTTTPFSETMDVLAMGSQMTNPALLAATAGKGPIQSIKLGRALAVTPAALAASRAASGHAVQAVNAPADTRKAEKAQFAQVEDRLTETEYRNLSNIMAILPARRTPQQNAYLQKYLGQ